MMQNLLRGDDGTERIISTDTDTHEGSPEDHETDKVDGGRVGGQCLSKSCENHDDEFETVDLLTTNIVCQPSETQLTDDCSARGSNLDGCI